MTAMTLVWPILPGKQEAWRRFCQTLLVGRSCEYAESRRRLGITKELIWLAQTPHGDLAVVYLEAPDPEHVLVQLGASDLPFDRWLRKQWRELHGLDLAQPPSVPANELVLEWAAS